MVVDFSQFNLQEDPTLILRNASGTPLGSLNAAIGVSVDIKFNEVSVLEFVLPAYVNGEKTENYENVIGMRLIELQNVGQFILISPKETGNGIKLQKSCKCYSLEYEFTFKNISLPKGTYNFWNPASPNETIIGMILEKMPSWSVGSIDSSLIGKYRTYETDSQNIYNFIKGTLQESYNCIFDFDTINRRINVRDASSVPDTKPVFISFDNLAKEITIEEDTENIFTSLDVNGADGVNIRDVNPMGTNKIINLDYFMTESNFTPEVINKYYAWKETFQNFQLPYYNLTIEHSMQVMRKVTESAALYALEQELAGLENILAVQLQAQAQGIPDMWDKIRETEEAIDAKKGEINGKTILIQEIDEEIAVLLSNLAEINNMTALTSFFTPSEMLVIDRYIKEGAVAESSFVVGVSGSFDGKNIGSNIQDKNISVSYSKIESFVNQKGRTIYDITGGNLYINSEDIVDAEVIKASAEIDTSDKLVFTAYLGAGSIGEQSFNSACISLTGSSMSVVGDLFAPDVETPSIMVGTTLIIESIDGYLFFTKDTSEYEKRAVAWDLFEYGKEALEKLSRPAYTFTVNSSNFLHLDEFVVFKNAISLGSKLYIEVMPDKILEPIAIGAKFSFDNPESLDLEFGDKYISSDSAFQLSDLLDKSISMGKSVDLSKFTYSAFVDSGASSSVKDFLNGALDVSKNAIMSSSNQAITWDDAGIRLRKWKDEAHTVYDEKQIWMNNNSVIFTKDNWATADIAIGEIANPEGVGNDGSGSLYGIAAPAIVGKLVAGQNLIIESFTEGGEVLAFRVDGSGCVLRNADFSVIEGNRQISINPNHGIVIGRYPVYTKDEEDNEIINEDNAKFWVDSDGGLHLKGIFEAASGEFTGKITATSGYIGGETGWTIGATSIYNGKPSYGSTTQGIYIGTNGIHLGGSANSFKVTPAGALTATNAEVSGKIVATSGYIGSGSSAWNIGNGSIYSGKSTLGSAAEGIYIGTDGIAISGSQGGFKVTADGVITTSNIVATGGTIGGCEITTDGILKVQSPNIESVNAAAITTGKINSDRIDGSTLNVVDGAKIADWDVGDGGLVHKDSYGDIDIKIVPGFIGFIKSGCHLEYDGISFDASGDGYPRLKYIATDNAYELRWYKSISDYVVIGSISK